MKGIVERERGQFKKKNAENEVKSEYAFKIFSFCISVRKTSKCHQNQLLVETEQCTGSAGISFLFNQVYLLILWSRVCFEMFIIVWFITPTFLEPKFRYRVYNIPPLYLKFSEMYPVQFITPCSDIFSWYPKPPKMFICFIFSF